MKHLLFISAFSLLASFSVASRSLAATDDTPQKASAPLTYDASSDQHPVPAACAKDPKYKQAYTQAFDSTRTGLSLFQTGTISFHQKPKDVIYTPKTNEICPASGEQGADSVLQACCENGAAAGEVALRAWINANMQKKIPNKPVTPEERCLKDFSRALEVGKFACPGVPQEGCPDFREPSYDACLIYGYIYGRAHCEQDSATEALDSDTMSGKTNTLVSSPEKTLDASFGKKAQ